MANEYDEAYQNALSSISEWCPGISQGKTKNGERWICSPLRSDHSPDSFSINASSGLWHDFATNEDGNALQLYARIQGIEEAHAVEHFLNISTPFIVNDPPARQGWSMRWHYVGNGVDFWVYRYEGNPKTFSPWHRELGQWVNKKPQQPKEGFPLLGLAELVKNKTGEVVLVEGEKTRDAIPSDILSTTWCGGASSIETVDFSPLKNRTVTLWGDNDEAGAKAMAKIKAKLEALNVTIKEVSQRPEWDKGDDAADRTPEERRQIIASAPITHKPKSLFPLVRFGDMEVKPPQWLIKGFLEADTLALIFGPSGAGKSFLTIDISAHIATGTPFAGKAIKTPGAVVYIAGEGFGGISRRLTAWKLHNKIDLSSAPIYVSKKAAAFGDPELMVHVEAAVKEVAEREPVRLIVIDTWARNMVGDENSTMDTSAAIRAVDDLRQAHGCSAIIVHHSGQAEAERSRGSSALKAALDAEYRVSNQDKIMQVFNTKMKDGEPPEDMAFSFEYVDLGYTDDDGEPVRSSAITPIDLSGLTKSTAREGKKQKEVLDFLARLDGQGITEEALKKEIGYKSRSAWLYAKNALLEKGLIVDRFGLIFLTEKEPEEK